MGSLSVDGLGQNNPDRSEGPWGAGCPRPDFAVSVLADFPRLRAGTKGRSADSKGGDKLDAHARTPGASLSASAARQVPSDMHIFQPY
jgi:hypothetical protein